MSYILCRQSPEKWIQRKVAHMFSISKKICPFAILAAAVLICGTGPSRAYGGDPPSDSSPGSAARAEAYLAQADSAFNTDRYLASRRLYEQALDKAKTINDSSLMTEASAMIARTYLIMNRPDSAQAWLEQAEKTADENKSRGWSRYLAVKGRYLWQKNQLEEATDLFKSLYDYCVKNRLPGRAIDAAHMVAITGNPKEQVEWGKKGIAQAEAGNITHWLGPLWNNLGATYEDMHQYDSALAAYEKARGYHYKYGTARNRVIADYAVGHILVKLGRYDEGSEWLKPVLTKFEEAQDHEFVGLTCRDLGDIGYASGDYEQALELYVRAKALLEEVNMDEWDPQGYKDLLDRIDDTRDKME
jgi:tetratricopeptide (TPR) repeat protein